MPENCRYDVAIVISKDYKIDDSIEESEFSGGKYAIFKVKHTVEDIKKAWSGILDLNIGIFEFDSIRWPCP